MTPWEVGLSWHVEWQRPAHVTHARVRQVHHARIAKNNSPSAAADWAKQKTALASFEEVTPACCGQQRR